MTTKKSGILTRRSLLKSSAATGAALSLGGVSMFNITGAFAAMADPAEVLKQVSVGKMVKKEYREQYKLADNDELWDSSKDWIRTADWEAIRKEHAGKTVRFAVGAADRESAADQVAPFEALSGIKIDLVAIPDDSMYDKIVAEFLGGTASFDAVQYFSPWLGDFGAQGFLKPLDEYVAKWKVPFEDFYPTYQANYGHWADKGVLGLPFDCDIQQVHVRPSILSKVLGGDVDRVKSIPTYDEMIRIAPELNKVQAGTNAIGMMCGRGFWATYTWQHIAAQYGMQLFNDKWEPIFNNDAGVKGLETIVALSKHAIEGVAAADWPTNRAAWLGGQVACNISWQDSGTQATRADQSKIGDDVLTIYEPRVAGGTYAPPNIAGSTSSVAVTSPEPEAAFLMLAYLTTASIMAINEANANGVAPGYQSVLKNEKLRAVSQPAKVWSEALDYAWCAPRLPQGFQIDQEIGFLINKVVVGELQPKAALDEAAGKVKTIMEKNGFYKGADPMNYAATEPGFWMGKGKTVPF